MTYPSIKENCIRPKYQEMKAKGVCALLLLINDYKNIKLLLQHTEQKSIDRRLGDEKKAVPRTTLNPSFERA